VRSFDTSVYADDLEPTHPTLMLVGLSELAMPLPLGGTVRPAA